MVKSMAVAMTCNCRQGDTMEHTKETAVKLEGRTFMMRVIEDIDYLLGLVKSDDDVPFWAVLWPAAVGMSEYFWESIDFRGQRVLELGAGLGLVGIVTAAKGADIVQTDFIPEALELAKENAKINGINNITYALADWREFSLTEKFDWIVGSDILYEPNLHSYLRSIFINNLKMGGCIVLADPGREDAQKFIEELVTEGFTLETVTREVHDNVRWVTVSLYFLRKPVILE